jgi:predicted GIY-YIG superfamily endonuclease
MRPHSVYRCFDKTGLLLYIGATFDVKDRMRKHKHASQWFHDVDRVDAELFNNRAEAFTAEKKAIKSECPKYNCTGVRVGGKSYNRKFKPPKSSASTGVTKLIAYMTENKLNQAKLAELSNVSKSILSRKFNGVTDLDYGSCVKLERATGIRGLAIHIMNEQIGERK